jgi:NAD(P)-dependent dehydrogenase (short-subunit alcohol dehydrogenase family)
MGILEGRTAVVTGAGRGIGSSVARLLAAEGAAVVVNDLGVTLDGSGRDSLPARQVVDEIVRGGGTAVADGGDVADFEAARALVRGAVDTFGRLDVLVNVAGILRDRMVFNMTEEEWDAVIRVHLKGTFNTVRHAAEYWRELRDESAHHRLVNFTSGSGLHGAPGQPNYAAAKMGIVGLTYSCANALAPYGVTANAIAPGAATRMTESVPGTRRDAAGPPAGERSPDNVAPLVAYLASEASDWCTGQVISAAGYQVGLYSTPQLVRQVASPVPWELDRLAQMLERVFRPAVAASSAASPIRPRPPSHARRA